MTVGIGQQLVYDRRGGGPPLVLIHGIGSRRQVWNPLLDDLAEHYDVIALDLPGFGASAQDGTEPGVGNYAARVAAFLDDLGLDAPHVAGNSMGGAIAIELGRMGRAGRVTAFSPAGFWTPLERRWCQAALATARAGVRLARPALPALVGRGAGRVAIAGLLMGHPIRLDPATLLADVHAAADAPAFAAALASFRDYDLRDPNQNLGHLRDIPVTIAWGSRDSLLLHRPQSGRARRVLPWARHVKLPSAGHVPFYDDPAACVAVLR